MFSLVLASLCFILQLCAAVPMTLKLGANERQCLYAQVDQLDSKVGFYFAVQKGGSFDIDLTIIAPDGKVQYHEPKEKQGEFSFSSHKTGEYQFCFSNDMSTFAEKSIEFEISVDTSTLKAELPPVVGDSTTKVEQSILSIESRTSNLLRTLQYYKTRNNRNESTVRSTESRMFWFSIFELALMVGMAVLQVTIVQLFFTGSRKNLV